MLGTDMFSLKGKRALITGSGQGIGLVLAEGLARAGAEVILNDIVPERLDAAVGGLTEKGLAARGARFDVTREEEVDSSVRELEKGGPIHILFNNAGIQDRAALEQMTKAQWSRVIETNLTSAFLVSRAVVKGMIARKEGKIVNTCSLLNELGRTTTANYAAAKGGLKMLTRAMAVEWAKHNIQVNAIGPGYFVTPLTQPLKDDPAFDAWLRTRTPAGRWGRIDELVGAAVFLASGASSFVNGQIIFVDGGLLASL